MVQQKRNIGLDLLRVIAVFLVLIRHLPPSPIEFPRVPKLILGRIQSLGWIGMDLFFVLSGFLVAGLIFREFRRTGRFQVGRFLVKRGFKIYPAFYSMLILTTMYFYCQNKAIAFSKVIIEALFVQNYLPGFWKLTWSLAVEEHFYVLVSLTFSFYLEIKRPIAKPFSFIPVVALGLGLGCLVIRYISADVNHHWMVYFTPTHKRIDSLFFGVLIAYWDQFKANFTEECRLHRLKLLFVGLVLFIPEFMIPLGSIWMKTIGLSLSYLASGCLLCSIRTFEFPWNIWFKGIQYLASRSYSIYLWHMVVYSLLPGYLTQIPNYSFSYAQKITLELLFTLGVGIGMANLIEIPMLRLRSILYKTSSPEKHRPILEGA